MAAKIVQRNKIFRALGIKDTKEADSVIDVTFGFLLYLKVGEQMQTANATFTKVSDDLLHVEQHLDMKDVVTSLNRNNIIRLT